MTNTGAGSTVTNAGTMTGDLSNKEGGKVTNSKDGTISGDVVRAVLTSLLHQKQSHAVLCKEHACMRKRNSMTDLFQEIGRTTYPEGGISELQIMR